MIHYFKNENHSVVKSNRNAEKTETTPQLHILQRRDSQIVRHFIKAFA
jgi:hypothetical protein